MSQVRSGSAADENVFVCGYPASMCDAAPRSTYLCCNCNSVLQRAQQTLCGHRYCSPCLARIVRNHQSPVCPKCQQEAPESLTESSNLSQETAFSDAAINKEIAELRVHCVTAGCHWGGLLRDYQEHKCDARSPDDPLQRKMEPAPRGKNSVKNVWKGKCRFSSLGCTYRGSREKMEEHERCSAAAHLSLVVPILLQLSLPEVTENGFHASVANSDTQGARRKLSDPQNGEMPSAAGEAPPIGLAVLEARLQMFENIITILNREMERTNAKMAAMLEQRGEEQQRVEAYEQQISSLHCTLAKKEAALSELHVRLTSLEQTSYDGVFLWKISDFMNKCHNAMTGQAVSLYSPAFYTARYGYKVCLRIYLNGDGAGKGTHISLFFAIMKGEYDALLPWPFAHKVTFVLIDHSNREHVFDAFRPDVLSASFQRPVSDMNIASGCPLFCPLCKVQPARNSYVKEDTIFIRCIID